MEILRKLIEDHKDFPKKGIVFKDILPLLLKPYVFKDLICSMAKWDKFNHCDAIIAIDARGFLFGSALAYHLSKPLVVARKPGKLPGELVEKSYELEYGENKLSIQKSAIDKFNNFIIVDDLLATGGTVNCVSDILLNEGKNIIGLSVVVELEELKGSEKIKFPINSLIKF